MIIYLYGADSYRRQQKLKEIIADYKNKHSSFAVESFDLEQVGGLDKLKDFTKAQSLFDKVKLGIINNGSLLDEALEKEYVALLKENSRSKEPTLVISENKKPAKNFSFLLDLDKPNLSQEFENLTGGQPEKFLLKEANGRGLIFDKESQNLLLQVYAGDSWGLITELDKLALLDEKKITKKVLENHLHALLPINIFLAIDQMRSSKNIGQRLALLEELLERSEEPRMIFNILAVSPYADSSWKQKAADYDAAIKIGKLEYEEALLDLVVSDLPAGRQASN
ncbi:MAG: hypothetical protein HYY86_01395 [Candidatus Harrisonbacteria bacterium]|nr:hypothetical protein [Candidatus Harrisonbacteria bacterium]